jgi:SAM-dependent methyltransferase
MDAFEIDPAGRTHGIEVTLSGAPALGKPASYGDFVLGRRMQLIDEMVADARGSPVARDTGTTTPNDVTPRIPEGLRDDRDLFRGDRPFSHGDRLHFHGDRLLDVGCGNGAQTVRLLDRFRHVVGLDVVREHLEMFHRALAGLDDTNCSTVLYDGTRMPFRDSEFDAVLSIETLEHVRSEQQLLSEIRRVLRPEGILVLSVPNKWWIFETHGANLPLLPWNRVPFFSWLPPAIHARFARARIYTHRGALRLLAAAGFQVLASRYLAAPMDVIRNRSLAGTLRATIFRGPGTRIPLLSTSIFVVARKSAGA